MGCALTGDETLSYVEVADRFSEVLGREIRYANPSVLGFVRRMREQEHPWAFVLVMTGIYLTARFGLAAPLDGRSGTRVGTTADLDAHVHPRLPVVLDV